MLRESLIRALVGRNVALLLFESTVDPRAVHSAADRILFLSRASGRRSCNLRRNFSPSARPRADFFTSRLSDYVAGAKGEIAQYRVIS